MNLPAESLQQAGRLVKLCFCSVCAGFKILQVFIIFNINSSAEFFLKISGMLTINEKASGI